MNTSRFALLALATSALVLPVRAEEGADKPKPDPAKVFAKMDTNADGTLSKEEFMAMPKRQKDPVKGAEKWTRLDTDANGSLTLEEYKAGFKKAKDSGKEAKSSGSSEE